MDPYGLGLFPFGVKSALIDLWLFIKGPDGPKWVYTLCVRVGIYLRLMRQVISSLVAAFEQQSTSRRSLGGFVPGRSRNGTRNDILDSSLTPFNVVLVPTNSDFEHMGGLLFEFI